MLTKWMWILGLIASMFVYGKSSPVTITDASYLRPLNKPTTNVHSPRSQWSYRPQEDFDHYTYEGISHGSTLKATESSYERQNESGSPQDYWWSNPSWQNYTNTNYYGSSKPLYGYVDASNGATGFYYKNPVDKTHSRYPYSQVTSSHVGVKNNLSNKLQILSVDTSGKHKLKKTALQQSVPDYKKVVFSRLVKPNGKYKYASQNHPLYKRYYYQSPYQRYSIPSSEMIRYKGLINPSGGYFKKTTSSTRPNQDPGRRHTTERMDDAYPDGSATLEDYSAFNETNHNYEETYEEEEKTNSDSEEGTTRGYYGDRIYMSTQVPLVTFDKTGVKNKYYIIRRTSDDDDIETLFE